MVGGIVFLCQEVAMPPSQMEEVNPVDADTYCNIGYQFDKVYGNGNPNSTTIGANINATVYIGNKDRKTKDNRPVSIPASGSGNGGYYYGRPACTLAWYYRWGVVNSISYVQSISEYDSRYDMHDSEGKTHASGAHLSDLKGTWYGISTGSTSAGGAFYYTIYYSPRFTVNLNGGRGPDGWTGPGFSAASALPTYLYYNTYTQSGTTAFPNATIYANDPATMGNKPNPAYYGTLKPQRTGYTFNGYYSATGGYQIVSSTGAWTITRDSHLCKAQTIYAHWTANLYNLTANANGGSIPSTSGWSGTGSTASKSVAFDSSPGTMPKPTRTGYTLAGWYTAASGGTKVANADGSFISNVSGYTDSNTRWKRSTETTLYAHWTANHYTITADANGGTNAAKDGWTLASDKKTSTMNFIYNQPASAMPIASRTGYTCGGWYTAASGGTKVANADGSFIASVSGYTDANKKWVRAAATTLYAHWTANHYTITADANGGTNAAKDGWTLASDKKTSTMSFTYGQAASAMPSVTAPDGKRRTINGWYTAASGGTKVANADGTFIASISGYTDASKNWVRASNTTLYAQYTETVLTIRYHLNGGTDVESDANFTSGDPCRTDQWKYSLSTQYGLTNCTDTARVYRTGYTASANYNTKADKSGKDIHQDNLKTTVAVAEAAGVLSTLKTQDTTIDIYMIWNINNYTLKIDPNGGIYNSSTSMSTFSQNYYTTKAIANPTRTGYTFAGWVATKEINGATWAQILYHFNDSGSQLFASSDNLSSQTKNDFYRNSQFANLARYNLTSYEFLLQYSHISGYNQWKQTSNPATANNTISGYQAVSISWSDNAWGGIAKSSTTASTFIDGSPGTGTWFYALGAYAAWNGGIPGPSSAEKQVTRLWLKTDSTLSNLRPTASFHNDDALGSSNYYYFKDESVTLKALWIINNYTLTANANGGSIPTTSGWTGTGATATKTVTYNAAYGTLPVPTKTGYGFAGWWTQASGGTQVGATTKMGAADTTIYAHWTISSYTLTADCHGGTAPSTLPTGWTANGQQPYRTLNYQSTYGTLPEPTRQGYIFAGWFTAASGGSEVNSSTKMGAANATIYARWVDSWVKDMSNDNPVLDQADGYYIIDSAQKLACLAYLVNYNIDNGKWASYQYKQTADINLSAHYWQPIGNATHPFKGTYDGTTFDIHNMKTYCGANDYEAYNGVGMFGYISGATIKNVNNYDVNIKGGYLVAGIVGSASDVNIRNCVVSGNINADGKRVGGIVGYANGIVIKSCRNETDVSSNSSLLGGIIGDSNGKTEVDSCVNSGQIKNLSSNGSGIFEGIGGIVGDANGNSFMISNCINNGSVTSVSNKNYDCVGGIVGSSYTENTSSNSSILNCQNLGRLEGKFNIGGIAGCNSLAAIKYCLNTGDVNITSDYNDIGTGGIVGVAYNTGVIESCFVSCTLTTPNGVRGNVGAIIGRYAGTEFDPVIKYCGAKTTVVGNPYHYGVFVGEDEQAVNALENSYSLMMYGSTKVNRITATTGGMDDKFGMISSIHDGLPVPLGIYHTSQYGTTTGIASTLKGSQYGCTTA